MDLQVGQGAHPDDHACSHGDATVHGQSPSYEERIGQLQELLSVKRSKTVCIFSSLTQLTLLLSQLTSTLSAFFEDGSGGVYHVFFLSIPLTFCDIVSFVVC